MWPMRKQRNYVVKPTGRSGFVYREGDRAVSVFSEMLVRDDFDIVAYLSRIDYWDSPEGPIPLTDEDRARIEQNAEEGLRVKIEWA
jgi:hypothetical protein